jgi:multidrug resistance efflux pump
MHSGNGLAGHMTVQIQKAIQDNAAAALKSAQDMKAFEQIRAPFAGTITARFIDVGSLVTSGSVTTVHTLFNLVQSDPVRVLVHVPQADISTVRPGTPAAITVDEYPNETFASKRRRSIRSKFADASIADRRSKSGRSPVRSDVRPRQIRRAEPDGGPIDTGQRNSDRRERVSRRGRRCL